MDRSAQVEPASASAACACNLALPVGAYNEEAFHYLLAVEHRRFERSYQPFVLALIENAVVSPERQGMDPVLGARITEALTRSLRETDVIGWYREG